jgi:trk system potassium uptake protein TrkH
VLSLALVVGHRDDLRRLVDPAVADENLALGMRIHARRVLVVYLLLTLIGLGVVTAAGMPWPAAPIHTLAAVSTGGFNAFADSLAGAARSVQIALLGVAFAAALPLPLYYRVWLQGPRALLQAAELWALVLAVAVVSSLLWLLGGLLPLDALLQGLTAQTTTGFSTIEIAGLADSSKLLLIFSMLTGAGMGSTAGGIKLLRLLILIRLIQLAILRTQLPRHAVVRPSIGGHDLDTHQIEQTVVVIVLFLVLTGLSWLAFVSIGHVPIDALFEVVSAMGTVGLSTGITGPELAPALKVLLTLNMLAGRVEVLALLVLISPRSWLPR